MTRRRATEEFLELLARPVDTHQKGDAHEGQVGQGGQDGQ